MQLTRRNYHICLDILFALALGVACLWYLFDAYSASARTTNLILILPATITGALLAVIIAVQSALAARRSPETGSPSKEEGKAAEPPAIDPRSFAIMGCFVVYVLLMDRIGFDASTFLFVLISIVILGERRIYLLLLYTVIFTVLNIYLQKFTSYNIPLLIL